MGKLLRKHLGWVKTVKDWHSYPLLVLSLGIAVFFVVLSFFRTPTAPETALFQAIILICGLLGSYIFGRNAAKIAARDKIKLHARPAFRRVIALYNSLIRLSIKIEGLKGEKFDHRLEQIQALVNEHIETGQDTVEDWRDIIPEDVAEIEKRLKGEVPRDDNAR